MSINRTNLCMLLSVLYFARLQSSSRRIRDLILIGSPCANPGCKRVDGGAKGSAGEGAEGISTTKRDQRVFWQLV